jgi:hypothetical protein
VGTWSSSATNYSSARFFGNNLMLPAVGSRNTSSGLLHYRGYYGIYWSSSERTGGNSWELIFGSSYSDESDYFSSLGLPVRCVAE